MSESNDKKKFLFEHGIDFCRPQKIVVKRMSLRNVKQKMLIEESRFKLLFKNRDDEFIFCSKASEILRQFFAAEVLLLLFFKEKKKKLFFQSMFWRLSRSAFMRG